MEQSVFEAKTSNVKIENYKNVDISFKDVKTEPKELSCTLSENGQSELEGVKNYTVTAHTKQVSKVLTAGNVMKQKNKPLNIHVCNNTTPCQGMGEMKVTRDHCLKNECSSGNGIDSYPSIKSEVVVKEEPDPDNIQYLAAIGSGTAQCTNNEQQIEQDSLIDVKHEYNNTEEQTIDNVSPVIQDEVQSDGTGSMEKRTYTCEYCHKSFSKKSSLISHWSTHTGETPYSCPFCEKKFSIRSNRNVHMLIHTGVRPHECEVCNKTFRQSGQLRQHMRIHKGEKPYMCNTCFKTFRNSSALVTHQRIHTGERPYNCDICSRSFTTSTSLKTHQVTHTGKMLYNCPLCGREFNRRNNLNVHIKRHDKNRSFTCPICCNGFVMRAHLLTHVQRCHKVQLSPEDVKTMCSHEEDGVTTRITDIKQEQSS